MGSSFRAQCNECGTEFTVSGGGGFFFDLLHCDTCGAERSVGHSELGEIHHRYVQGLPGSYAIAGADIDAEIQANPIGEPLSEAEYHEAVSRYCGPCSCGGTFTYGAPARCPRCRSTTERWTSIGGDVLYD